MSNIHFRDYEIISRIDEYDVPQVGILKLGLPDPYPALFWKRDGDLVLFNFSLTERYLGVPEPIFEALAKTEVLHIIDLDRNIVHEISKS